jgi:hypothetical protein
MLASPPWDHAGQMVPHRLDVTGLGGLKLAQADHFRRDIHLGVGGPGAARSKPHASPHRRRDEPPRPIGRTARQPQPTRPGSRRGSRRASLGQPGALRTGGCVRPPGHRAGGVGWRRGTPCRRLNEHRGGIYATWLEDAGIPARVIDELMGHEATSRGGQQRGSAMGPTTGTPPRGDGRPPRHGDPATPHGGAGGR